MRRLHACVGRRHVLLEPEAKLHVVAKQFRTHLLIRVKHDPPVVAARQATGVLARVARGVVLCQQISGGTRNTVLGKRIARSLVGLTQQAELSNVADARGCSHGIGEGNHAVGVDFVVGKLLGDTDGGDDVDGARGVIVKRVVGLRLANNIASDHHRAHIIHDRVGDDIERVGKIGARAVVCLTPTRAQRLFGHPRRVHHDRIRLVRHDHSIKPNAKPCIGRSRECDGCLKHNAQARS